MSDAVVAPAAAVVEAAPAAVTPAVAAPAAGTLMTPPVEAAPAAAPVLDAEGKPVEAAPAVADAPIEYADFTVPEGVTLNAELVGDLKAFAAEHKLDQATAQKVADLGVKQAAQFQAAMAKNVTDAQAAWLEAAKTDTEFGGDKLTASLATAKRALDTFGTPALTQLLNESGLGNHPEIIRAFVKAGAAISEDKLVSAGAGPGEKQATNAERLYPKMKGA